MAGDWIKIRKELPDDPAVIAIAEDLGIEQDAVVGKLFRVWIWADSQLVDGNATGVTFLFLDRYVSVTGFAECMQKHGWLCENSGGISFPKFERHMGKSAKRRALGKIRSQEFRNAANVTKALPEKRREENKKYPSKTSSKTPINYQEQVETWNRIADECNLPRIQKLTDDRKKKLRDRLRENENFWEDVLTALKNRNEWALESIQGTFDQIMRPSFVQKLFEGNYAENNKPKVERVQGEDGIWRRK